MKKVLIVALTAMLASSASASLLVYEGFEYEFGKPASWYADAIAGQSGGTGWTGSWTATARDMGIGDGLSYGSLTTAGGAAYSDVGVAGSTGWSGTDPNRWDGLARDFADIATTDGTSVWVSYLLNDNGPTATFGQWAGMKFIADPTYFGLAGGGGTWIVGATGSALKPTTNATHMVVMQIQYGAATMDSYLWVDPSDASLAGANLAQSDAMLSALGVAKAGVNSAVLDNTHKGQMDEIRIGTTFADVTPIPEPASILLLVSGILGAYKLRRRG